MTSNLQKSIGYVNLTRAEALTLYFMQLIRDCLMLEFDFFFRLDVRPPQFYSLQAFYQDSRHCRHASSDLYERRASISKIVEFLLSAGPGIQLTSNRHFLNDVVGLGAGRAKRTVFFDFHEIILLWRRQRSQNIEFCSERVDIPLNI